MSDAVILVHGLWMTGLELSLLKHRLEGEHGFLCETFAYASVTGSMTDHVRNLRELTQDVVRRQQPDKLHFVGHSLGGIVCYRLLQGTHDLPPGRAVFLGTPMQGSRAIEVISQWTLGRVAVGEEARRELSAAEARVWDGRRDIGLIAGSSNIGIGRLLSADLGEHSDGTVRIEETYLHGAADHLILPVTHTSMVFSPEVARQVACFLRDGKFDHSLVG